MRSLYRGNVHAANRPGAVWSALLALAAITSSCASPDQQNGTAEAGVAAEADTDGAERADGDGGGAEGGGTADGTSGTAPTDASPPASPATEDGNRSRLTATPVDFGTVEPLTDPLMSLDPEDPTNGTAIVVVDRVYTTDTYADAASPDDAEFLVVEVQVLTETDGYLIGDTFRVGIGDAWQGPAGAPSGGLDAPRVVNDEVVFEVPADTSTLVFQAGEPDSLDNGGATAEFSVTLAPAPTSAAAPPLPTSDEIAAATADVTLAGPDASMTSYPTRPEDGVVELSIDEVTTGLVHGDDAARDGWKFLVLALRLTVETDGYLSNDAFRLRVGGEWLSPVVVFNGRFDPGDVVSGEIVFEVPRAATELLLEGGEPERWDDGGQRAVYDIVLS